MHDDHLIRDTSNSFPAPLMTSVCAWLDCSFLLCNAACFSVSANALCSNRTHCCQLIHLWFSAAASFARLPLLPRRPTSDEPGPRRPQGLRTNVD